MPTMTITYTAGEGTRFAAALGKVQGLVDANGIPRSATAAEAKLFLIGTMRGVTLQVEKEAAMQAITDSPFNPS